MNKSASPTPRRPVDTYRFEAAVRRLAWTRLAAWCRARDTVRALGALSDRELLDVGLVRGQIEAAAKSASRRA